MFLFCGQQPLVPLLLPGPPFFRLFFTYLSTTLIPGWSASPCTCNGLPLPCSVIPGQGLSVRPSALRRGAALRSPTWQTSKNASLATKGCFRRQPRTTRARLWWQRAKVLLINVTRGSFLTSPLVLRGELGHQGWNLSPRGNVHPFVHPQGETLSTV
jgi:hypothetical protein